MKKTLHSLLAAAVLFGGIAAAGSASAADLNVRVRLPNGTFLSLDDGPSRPWYADRRVSVYDRYYYDPAQRVYVVYDDRHPPKNWRQWQKRSHTIVRTRTVVRHDDGRGRDNDRGRGNDHRDNGWHGQR